MPSRTLPKDLARARARARRMRRLRRAAAPYPRQDKCRAITAVSPARRLEAGKLRRPGGQTGLSVGAALPAGRMQAGTAWSRSRRRKAAASPDSIKSASQPSAPRREDDDHAGADRAAASGRKHERRTTRRGRDPDTRFSAKRSRARDSAGRGGDLGAGGLGSARASTREHASGRVGAGARMRGNAIAPAAGHVR